MNALKIGTMTLGVEIVTPSIARNWLEFNKGNRRIRAADVNRYANDMRSGKWELKPLAICFDDRGVLGNGQHTLSAIVTSNTTQPLLVARNVPRSTIAAMDIGRTRTITDVAHFLEIDIDRRRAAVARLLGHSFDPKGSGLPFTQVFELYTQHQEAIDAASQMAGTNRGVINAIPIAIGARAFYTQDRQRLAQWFEVLRSGMAAGAQDSAAIRYRDWALQSNPTGATARRELYQKAESSLHAFLARRPLSKLYPADAELFPIPE